MRSGAKILLTQPSHTLSPQHTQFVGPGSKILGVATQNGPKIDVATIYLGQSSFVVVGQKTTKVKISVFLKYVEFFDRET